MLHKNSLEAAKPAGGKNKKQKHVSANFDQSAANWVAVELNFGIQQYY